MRSPPGEGDSLGPREPCLAWLLSESCPAWNPPDLHQQVCPGQKQASRHRAPAHRRIAENKPSTPKPEGGGRLSLGTFSLLRCSQQEFPVPASLPPCLVRGTAGPLLLPSLHAPNSARLHLSWDRGQASGVSSLQAVWPGAGHFAFLGLGVISRVLLQTEPRMEEPRLVTDLPVSEIVPRPSSLHPGNRTPQPADLRASGTDGHSPPWGPPPPLGAGTHVPMCNGGQGTTMQGQGHGHTDP